MARPKNNETREKILKNAYSRFLTYGYDGVYLKEIAEDTGITATLLHHYFPAKADLVIHIIYDLLLKTQDYLKEKYHAKEHAPVNGFSLSLAMITYMFDVLARNNGQMLSVYSYVLCDTKLMNEIVDFCCDTISMPETVDTVEKRYGQFIFWGGASQMIVLYLKRRLPFSIREGLIQLYCQFMTSIGMTDEEQSFVLSECDKITQQNDLDEFYDKYIRSIDHFIYCEW
ncbi:MAG: TetR/AcrR family transcriptional regulator [Mogibacterium sp.]|nr:TetR/AcrR family transcriptional regulator [Mogibacterium sp.]